MSGRDVDIGRVVEAGLGRVEGRVLRRAVAGDVDLERGREGAEAAQVAQIFLGQLLRVDQTRHQGLGVEVGDDQRRQVLLAGFGDDAGGTALAHQHLGDRAVGLDLQPEAGAGLGDRLGDRAHAALDEAPAAGTLVLAHQVVQQHIGGARGLGAGEGADRGVVGEHRLDHVALEPLRQVVVGGLGEQVDDAVELGADLAVLPGDLGRLLQVRPVAAGRVDRRLEQKRADDLERFLQIGVEGGVGLGILPGEAGEVGLGGLRHRPRRSAGRRSTSGQNRSLAGSTSSPKRRSSRSAMIRGCRMLIT